MAMRELTLWQGKVATEVAVHGDGPPLVFLHGPWGLRHDGEFLRRLAGTHTVYAPKHPGTSERDAEAIHQIDDWLDLVVYYGELFDRLEIGKVALAGHSIGGMLACEIAAAMPERVGRLILIDPVGLWRDDLPVKNWMILSPADLACGAVRRSRRRSCAGIFRPAQRNRGADRGPGRPDLVASLHRQVRLADPRQGLEEAHPPHRGADIDRLGQGGRRHRTGLCRRIRPAHRRCPRRDHRGRRPPAASGASRARRARGAGFSGALSDRLRWSQSSAAAPIDSAYIFRHHDNNDDLQHALRSRQPDIDSIDTDNAFKVGLRPAKLQPDPHAVRQ